MLKYHFAAFTKYFLIVLKKLIRKTCWKFRDIAFGPGRSSEPQWLRYYQLTIPDLNFSLS